MYMMAQTVSTIVQAGGLNSDIELARKGQVDKQIDIKRYKYVTQNET
jgi:hypothetical protein